MSEERSLYFSFTDYELDPTFWEEFYKKNNCKFIMYGQEVCPDTDRLHFQGCIQFNDRRTWEQARKLAGTRHIEMCYKSIFANIAYCGKEGQVVVLGTRPAQGKRTDLAQCYELIDNGTSLKEISKLYPQQWSMYNRSFEKYIQMHNIQQECRDWPTEVLIFEGGTGTGKSRRAKELGAKPIWLSGADPGDPFVRGYKGQKIVVINEFKHERVTLEWMLDFTDRYEFEINVKGGSMPWLARTIILTTNSDSSRWWRGADKKQLEAWKRRITRVEKFE